MATWISPGNFPLCHSSSLSLLGHTSTMREARNRKGQILRTQGEIQNRRTSWCFKTSNRSTAFAVSQVLSSSTFHHPVMGSLWVAFPAGQKERPQGRKPWGSRGTSVGVKQLQWKEVMISSTRPKHNAAATMRATWDLVPSSDLSSVAFPDLKLDTLIIPYTQALCQPGSSRGWLERILQHWALRTGMAQPQLFNMDGHIPPTPRELLIQLPQGGFGSSWELTEQVCQDTLPCAVQHSCAVTSGALSHIAESSVSDAAQDVAPCTNWWGTSHLPCLNPWLCWPLRTYK